MKKEFVEAFEIISWSCFCNQRV